MFSRSFSRNSPCPSSSSSAFNEDATTGGGTVSTSSPKSYTVVGSGTNFTSPTTGFKKGDIILAADSKATALDLSGNMTHLTVDRMLQLSTHTAVLTGGAAEGMEMIGPVIFLAGLMHHIARDKERTAATGREN